MHSNWRSAQLRRLEVVEAGRRRRWSEDEKLKIVLESVQAPRQISATARRYGLSRSQLLQWRGRRGDHLRVTWLEGQGACLFTKRRARAGLCPRSGSVRHRPGAPGPLCEGLLRQAAKNGVLHRICGCAAHLAS